MDEFSCGAAKFKALNGFFYIGPDTDDSSSLLPLEEGVRYFRLNSPLDLDIACDYVKDGDVSVSPASTADDAGPAAVGPVVGDAVSDDTIDGTGPNGSETEGDSQSADASAGGDSPLSGGAGVEDAEESSEAEATDEAGLSVASQGVDLPAGANAPQGADGSIEDVEVLVGSEAPDGAEADGGLQGANASFGRNVPFRGDGSVEDVEESREPSQTNEAGALVFERDTLGGDLIIDTEGPFVSSEPNPIVTPGTTDEVFSFTTEGDTLSSSVTAEVEPDSTPFDTANISTGFASQEQSGPTTEPLITAVPQPGAEGERDLDSPVALPDASSEPASPGTPDGSSEPTLNSDDTTNDTTNDTSDDTSDGTTDGNTDDTTDTSLGAAPEVESSFSEQPDASVAPDESAESSSSCFPSHATVELDDGSVKTMSQLQIGDNVKVRHDLFSPVFMWTHKVSDSVNKFVKIQTAGGASISLTAGHFLYASNNLVAAGSIKNGDTLELGSGIVSVVTSVEEITSTGLYNPQTLHGDIVVNKIRASTYTTAVEPAAAHALLTPLRSVFDAFGWSCAALENGARGAASAMPQIGSVLL